MWRAIALIIIAIIEYFSRRRFARRVDDVQKEHDAIEENPSDWFEGHFGTGGDRVRVDDLVAAEQLGDVPAANADGADSAGVRIETDLDRDSEG